MTTQTTSVLTATTNMPDMRVNPPAGTLTRMFMVASRLDRVGMGMLRTGLVRNCPALDRRPEIRPL